MRVNKDLMKIKKWCIEHITLTLESVAGLSKVNTTNLDKAIKKWENTKEEDLGELEDLKECKEIYDIVKNWTPIK